MISGSAHYYTALLMIAVPVVVMAVQGPPAKPAPIPPPPDVAAPPKDATTTPSGLAFKVLQPGTGTAKPAATDIVTVHYTGWTTDGTMFDSSSLPERNGHLPSRSRDQRLGRGCATDGRRREAPFVDSQTLAYNGQAGRPAGMLVFDIELLELAPSPRVAPPDVAAAPADAKRTASGLAYKVLKAGTGTEHPRRESQVTVHYTGWQTDGRMFDSSVERGAPDELRPGRRDSRLDRGRPVDGGGREDPFLDSQDLAYRGRVAHRPGCSSSTWSSSPSASVPGAPGGAQFTADRGDHARRLDHAVLRHTAAHRLSRAGVQRLVSNGQVLVNGQPASRPAQRVRSGDVVHIESAPARTRTAPAAEPLPLEVLYEDDHLMVVNKPAGQVAHPSFKNTTGTLLNALLGHAAAAGSRWQPHLVQRLDKGTSGLLLVAKSQAIQTALQRASITKDYLALVWGRPVPATGRIETPLGRDRSTGGEWWRASPEPRPSPSTARSRERAALPTD